VVVVGFRSSSGLVAPAFSLRFPGHHNSIVYMCMHKHALARPLRLIKETKHAPGGDAAIASSSHSPLASSDSQTTTMTACALQVAMWQLCAHAASMARTVCTVPHAMETMRKQEQGNRDRGERMAYHPVEHIRKQLYIHSIDSWVAFVRSNVHTISMLRRVTPSYANSYAKSCKVA
jgi:hypothetical protein